MSESKNVTSTVLCQKSVQWKSKKMEKWQRRKYWAALFKKNECTSIDICMYVCIYIYDVYTYSERYDGYIYRERDTEKDIDTDTENDRLISIYIYINPIIRVYKNI
jgi:hypothetical protein